MSETLRKSTLTCRQTDQANVRGRPRADQPSNQTSSKETKVHGRIILGAYLPRCDPKLYLMTAVSVCKRNRSWQHPATAGVLQELIRLGRTRGHVQDPLNHILLSMLYSRWTLYYKTYQFWLLSWPHLWKCCQPEWASQWGGNGFGEYTVLYSANKVPVDFIDGEFLCREKIKND